MRFTLKEYQEEASADVLKVLRRATRDTDEDASSHWSVSLSAPTGAGKTVIASAVIETLFDISGGAAEDPLATVLWVTDSPSLNEQTKRKMFQAASSLGLDQLKTIGSGFDEERFAPRRVYFLNIQKLARTNPLARSNTNARTHSLWQTIGNTIEAVGGHFYVVIDEAHRGMKSESDRETIVSRIINGQEGSNRPAPVVWGISATPLRFLQAIDRWAPRTSKAITIPTEDVRSSGLLKDLIILDNPAASQQLGDTTLVRAAVAKTREFEASWAAYAETQDEPAVVPVLVVQIKNTPSESEMAELLAAIFDAWPGLDDMNIVNTFGEHTSLSIGSHTIAYMAPQEIQDDLDVRIALCKDAISTGWDCPRAEVIVSLRGARDYTYIAQLIGRMVRTPLARSIVTDQSLNTVNAYLPHFNKEEVDRIVERFSEGRADEPPVDVITQPVRIWRNPNVAEDVFDLLSHLPTYVVPGKAHRSQVSRLLRLATLLVGDNIREDAINDALSRLLGTLDTARDGLEADGSFEKTLRQVKSLRIERSHALLGVESLTDLPDEATYDMILDENNVEDLFKVARRKLPEGVAQSYWDRELAKAGDDADPLEAKAVVAVLALHPDVVEAVEAAAEQLVRLWLREYGRSISALTDVRRVSYEAVRRQAREAELTDLVIPEVNVVADSAQHWNLHLLSAEDGTYPCKVKGWEQLVLEAELADDTLLGWYRNPVGGSSTLRVIYPGDVYDKPMYPDFIFFHRGEKGPTASIVDPHGYHLTDAISKLRGLANYADQHGDSYLRIESVVKTPAGDLMALDLKSPTVRAAVQAHGDASVLTLFEQHGGRYR